MPWSTILIDVSSYEIIISNVLDDRCLISCGTANFFSIKNTTKVMKNFLIMLLISTCLTWRFKLNNIKIILI